MIRAALVHPLTPFVVRHEGQGKDDERENGESELHKDWDQGLGTRDLGPGTRENPWTAFRFSERASWGG